MKKIIAFVIFLFIFYTVAGHSETESEKNISSFGVGFNLIGRSLIGVNMDYSYGQFDIAGNIGKIASQPNGVSISFDLKYFPLNWDFNPFLAIGTSYFYASEYHYYDDVINPIIKAWNILSFGGGMMFGREGGITFGFDFHIFGFWTQGIENYGGGQIRLGNSRKLFLSPGVFMGWHF